MRGSLLSLLLLFARSFAQNLGNEPPCATACLSSAILSAGCQLGDQACQCGSAIGAIGGFAAPCLISNCPITALVAVQSIGSQLCVDYSVPAGLTTIVASNATTTLTSTAASSSSSSSVVATTTATGSSSSSMVITSISSSSTGTITGTGSGSARTATSSTPASTGGVRASYAAPLGGVLGMVLGAVVIL